MSANDLNGGREPLFLETIPGQASQLTRADGTRLGSPVTATSTPDGGLAFPLGDAVYGLSLILTPADFYPVVCAALVAGSTVSQSGSVVTVSATGHGAIGSTAKNGSRFYFPGSPSIPAGVYSGFEWVDANTLRFARASATVASESINLGTAFVSAGTLASMQIPAKSLGRRGRMTLNVNRLCDTGGTNHFVRLAYGGTVLSSGAMSTSYAGEQRITVRNVSASKQIGASNADVIGGNSQITGTVDSTVEQTAAIQFQLSAAGTWMVVEGLDLEIVGLG